MKKKIKLLYEQAFSGSRKLIAVVILALLSTVAWSQPIVPFTIVNRSNPAVADANIFVAVVGEQPAGYHVWIDVKTGQVRPMSVSDNTVQGPTPGGNMGPGNNGRYANCFSRLSEIPNKVINIPAIAGCRILISFNQQLYLYFFGASGSPKGYAAPDLNNPNDPNQGIRFENIELTNAANGLWVNTTRVDTYQYPMGLEVWGNNSFYGKVGELMTHAQILSQWQSTAPAAFAACYDAGKGIIHFPSKIAAFKPGGAQANYFGSYIDQIWAKYTAGDLVFNAGDAGTWRGRVSGSQFRFTRASDGMVGIIPSKPTTQDALEAKGALATGNEFDLVVQAQIAAAINRHAIDLNLALGATQDFATASKYYVTSPYNWYAKFWHRTDISHNSKTYAFAYDDVFNHSSTVNAPSPTRATITIGGFAGTCTPSAITPYIMINNNGTWLNQSTASVAAGGSFQLAPHPLNVGTWSWTGPNGFTANTRNFTRNSVTTSMSGNYVARYTNTCGAVTTHTFTITVTGGSFSQTIEAENYAAMSGVVTEPCSEGGLNVGSFNTGDWTAYNVNIPAAGTYKVSYRVASIYTGRTLRLERANGTVQLGTITIPNTGDWQTWTSISHNVSLPAGAYAIGIATSTGGFNINRLHITNNLSARSASEEEIVLERVNEEESKFHLSPNPAKDQLFIRDYENVKSVKIYSIQGQEMIAVERPGSSISVSSLTPGFHIAVIQKLDRSLRKEKVVIEK